MKFKPIPTSQDKLKNMAYNVFILFYETTGTFLLAHLKNLNPSLRPPKYVWSYKGEPLLVCNQPTHYLADFTANIDVNMNDYCAILSNAYHSFKKICDGNPQKALEALNVTLTTQNHSQKAETTYPRDESEYIMSPPIPIRVKPKFTAIPTEGNQLLFKAAADRFKRLCDDANDKTEKLQDATKNTTD